MSAYYNEHDPKAAAWLRELIKQCHIADGVVDERSIEDVQPDELREFTQCHFFAGIGVWSYALRRAGWPDNKPVWTGSCPCQPFSAAGKGDGFTDERHLWPAWFHLITQCEPDRIFGEQVASKDGLGWLDLVQTDLEAAGYACGAVDLCAAGIGAPHIRQRQWFVAERLGDTGIARLQRHGGSGEESVPEVWQGARRHDCTTGVAGGLADTDRDGRGSRCETAQTAGHGGAARATGGDAGHGQPRPTNGYWRDADWLFCRDGKWRPVEPGTFPLAHGASARVGRLRGYGNAINAEVATAFIEAYMSIDGRVI